MVQFNDTVIVRFITKGITYGIESYVDKIYPAYLEDSTMIDITKDNQFFEYDALVFLGRDLSGMLKAGRDKIKLTSDSEFKSIQGVIDYSKLPAGHMEVYI